MRNRRDFMRTLAAATAGGFVAQRGLSWAQGTAKRREIFIGKKRVKVIDSHAHLNSPEVASVTDRALARDIVKAQNEGVAAIVAKYPDRFIGMASMPLQFPDLAAEALEDGVKRLGFKGGGISAGWAGPKNLSAPEYDVFWSKVQQLGTYLFMHPGGTNGNGDPHFDGKGALGNTIGNPLETTIFFSHLIYEGTLDKFPGVKICGAHGGGYLPSYLGRTDSQCLRAPDACPGKKRPVEEYFKTQLMADCMVFREEGLRHLIAEMGVGQIVYGTDTPFKWGVSRISFSTRVSSTMRRRNRFSAAT